ncbi:MAG: helix-turn-helix transcriptional regulator [Lachnospiraceae bacterium]|nr:helix-turn-helix transcriptional regulator [Lachnospiraceae bacterium]
MVLAGINSKELAAKLGINESTLYRKINADGNFTREEIGKIVEILGIDNPQEIFFARELA